MVRIKGFTFAELLITFAIAGVLLAIALPSLVSAVKNNRITVQTNMFVGALNLARNEAVRYGRVATVCTSAGGLRCDGADWSDGWLVWVDRDGDGVVQGPERVHTYGALESDTLLVEQNGIDKIHFLADGSRAGRMPLEFLVTAERCSGNAARNVSVSPGGRPFTREMDCPLPAAGSATPFKDLTYSPRPTPRR